MNKKLIIGIVVLALGLGGWKIWTESSGGNFKSNQTSVKSNEESNVSEKGKDEKNKESNTSNDKEDSTASIFSQVVNKEDENTSIPQANGDFSSGNNKKEDSNTLSTGTKLINLPYKVLDTGMTIQEIGSFSGTFVEDGSNKNVSNILSIKIKNASKKDLQYGEIKLKINGKKIATFQVTNLPSGKSAIVSEITGDISYKSSNTYTCEAVNYGQIDNLPMNKNKVKVTSEDSTITIENISGKDLGTVYVYYKNKQGGSYLGGITYRVKFDDVAKGKSLSSQTKHFSKSNSEIVMVDTEK